MKITNYERRVMPEHMSMSTLCVQPKQVHSRKSLESHFLILWHLIYLKDEIGTGTHFSPKPSSIRFAQFGRIIAIRSLLYSKWMPFHLKSTERKSRCSFWFYSWRATLGFNYAFSLNSHENIQKNFYQIAINNCWFKIRSESKHMVNEHARMRECINKCM